MRTWSSSARAALGIASRRSCSSRSSSSGRMAEGYAVARGSGIDRLDPHRTVGPVVDEEREVTGGVARGFEYPQAAKVRPVRNGNECEVGLVGTVRVNFRMRRGSLDRIQAANPSGGLPGRGDRLAQGA